ncbi:unnamed protein product [Hymenolepis diminuta]|uniref:BTB domain-containing protein n=1 Tax=Hymenolepis diminuta TaxID=6216 RepID=A0A564Z0L5_HYMDI|nr:unnamed protein product [Hymenolepis diminuta]
MLIQYRTSRSKMDRLGIDVIYKIPRMKKYLMDARRRGESFTKLLIPIDGVTAKTFKLVIEWLSHRCYCFGKCYYEKQTFCPIMESFLERNRGRLFRLFLAADYLELEKLKFLIFSIFLKELKEKSLKEFCHEFCS